MIKVLELLPGKFVFPIFKNGLSSIEAFAKEKNIKWLINEQLEKLPMITLFLREPHERFVSGVHSFIEFEKRKNKDLDYETMLHCIEKHSVVNEHFMPQFFFIRNLMKYYTGMIELRGVSELREWIPNRNKPAIPEITEAQRQRINKIKYADNLHDALLFERHMYKIADMYYVSKKVNIRSLVAEIEYALPQA